MAIHHAVSGELINIRPLAGELAGAVTHTLYKSEHVEVFRVVLRAGKAMPPHRVAGEITVQCLEGSIEFITGITQVMRAGDMLCLAGGEMHALKAVEDASVLVTLLLHGA
jgi:quercetin dioxygenase-like cupin family protein